MRWLQDRSSKNWVCNDSPVFIGGQDVTRASDPGDRAELERLRGHVNINIQPSAEAAAGIHRKSTEIVGPLTRP
jgi:hypothetical protein